MEIVFLGTSASIPTKERSLPATFIKIAGKLLLIDCGEGTQRQLLHSGERCDIDYILLTHNHLDHVSGIEGLLATLNQVSDKTVTVFCTDQTYNLTKKYLYQSNIKICKVSSKDYTKILEIEDWSVFSFPVKHKDTKSLGFQFCKKERGVLNTKRANELNIPFGPERGLLVNGIPVTLHNGKKILPSDVLQCIKKTVSYVGDCGDLRRLYPYLKDTDLLIIEGTFVSKDRGIAKVSDHLVCSDIAQITKKWGIQRIIINHISPRNSISEILSDINHQNKIFISSDFDKIVLNENGVEYGDKNRDQVYQGG